MKIILASKSPRRKELLSLIRSDFEVKTEDVDERGIETAVINEGGDPLAVQIALASAKAAAVFKNLSAEEMRESVVIGADTSVVCDGLILGKPKDKDDARDMLYRLSGKTHEVITGVCVKTEAAEEKFTETTMVRFAKADFYQKDLIERYISSDEPYDKAGAYGIQQGGALLVEAVDGDYFNVVGLPVRKLARIIDSLERS